MRCDCRALSGQRRHRAARGVSEKAARLGKSARHALHRRRDPKRHGAARGVCSAISRRGWSPIFCLPERRSETVCTSRRVLLAKAACEGTSSRLCRAGSGDDAVACAAACEVFRRWTAVFLAHVKSVSRTLQEGLTALEANEHVLTCRSCGLAAAIVLRNAPTCERVHHAPDTAGVPSWPSGERSFPEAAVRCDKRTDFGVFGRAPTGTFHITGAFQIDAAVRI